MRRGEWFPEENGVTAVDTATYAVYLHHALRDVPQLDKLLRVGGALGVHALQFARYGGVDDRRVDLV